MPEHVFEFWMAIINHQDGNGLQFPPALLLHAEGLSPQVPRLFSKCEQQRSVRVGPLGPPCCRDEFLAGDPFDDVHDDFADGSQKCISTEPVGILVRILLEFDLYGIRRLSSYC